MLHTDAHSAVCNGRTVCDDGLVTQATIAMIRVTGDQKAFQDTLGGITFKGDRLTSDNMDYISTSVSLTDCDYVLPLSSVSSARIKVSASVGQCDVEYNNSKFNIIVKFYEVLRGSTGPDRYSLLTTTTGTITVKTNNSRDVDPIAFRPDLRDGSGMAGMKPIVRNYSEQGGQNQWMINYRYQSGEFGGCESQEGWCRLWPHGAVNESKYPIPYSETFYRVKYPGWQNPVQGQPPYAAQAGWNYESSGGSAAPQMLFAGLSEQSAPPSGTRLVYEMNDLGRMVYHLQTAPNGTVRLRTVERCTPSQAAGEGTVQWTVAYDEQGRIRFIHNASYADPNNPPDPNSITHATQCYVYDYTTGSATPSISYQSRPTIFDTWPNEPERQWELEFDDQGRAVKFQGGCGSCSGTGSFEHIAYHPDYEDTIIRKMNADGVVLIENDYEELEFGQYEPAGWMYIFDGDFEQQEVAAHDCDLFESQLFGWKCDSPSVAAQICDPNLGSQYLEINEDTLYQELYPVMPNTRYRLDIRIRAHVAQQNSYAFVKLYAVRDGSSPVELGESIALADVNMQEGIWVPYSMEWDSKEHPELIDFFNPYRLKIELTGDKVDMDAVKLSSSLWVGGNTKPLIKEQKVWAEGQANPVTALKRAFTADRQSDLYQVVERRYVQTGSNACRVAVVDYADDSFSTVVKRTEYANLGTSTTLPTGDSFVTTFGGDDPNRIYTTLSPNGKRADVQMYEYGNLIESYIKNTDNDANSLRELYEYEDLGDTGEWKLKKHINARGGVTEYEYYWNDVQWRGLLKKQTDPNTPAGRQVTEYVYDGARRVIRQTQKLDAERTIVTQYIYNPNTGYLDAVSVNGVSSQYYYNSFGQVIRQVDPDGVVTGKSYGTGGEVVSEFVVSANTADPNGVDTGLTLISQTRTIYTANGQIELIGKYKSDEEFVYQSDMTTNPANWIVTKNEYAPDGKQKKVIEDFGTGRTNLTTEYFYNLQGEIEKVLYPTGQWVKTVRDGRGLVILEETGHSTDTVVMQSAFDYDANGNLQWQKNPDGTEVHYTFDNFDRIKRVYQGSLSGPYTERFYSAAGDVEREIACEADGTVLSDRRMEYDALGNLKAERLCAEPDTLDNANDLVTHFVYDIAGNLRYEIKAGLSNADPNGHPAESDVVTELRYDNQGRRILTLDPRGIQSSADYTVGGRIKETVSPIDPSDPNAFISDFHHDPYGRMEKTVNPLGDYTVTVYNSLNQVIRQTVYDCNSTLDPADDFAVRQSRIEYDNLGNVIRQAVMADPASEDDIVLGADLVSDTVYDPNGTGLVWQQKTYIGTAATPAVTTFSYDDIGRLRKTVDPEGNEEIITYYSLNDGNPSQVKQIEQKQVDSEDSQNAYTVTAFLEYDDFGRVYKRILDEDGDGVKDAGDPVTTFTYDGMGRLKTETANDGVVAFMNYDGFGNVKTKIDDYGTGTENRTTELVYNRLNQQWKILAYDPNDTTQDVDIQVTEYEFDKNGNVTKILYPDEKSVEYVYNLLNKVDTEIQRNGTEIYYWYDWAGNLRFESDDPDGPDSTDVPGLLTEFRYNAAGNLVYAWKGIDLEEISESSFTYNGFGARTSETVRYDGSFAQTTTWTYDGSGNRLTQTHGQTALAAAHDGLGRIKTLDRGNDLIVSYTYMGSRTKTISYPEPGVLQSFGHDALGRVEQVRSAEGVDQTILDFIYTYDEVGNRNTVKYNHLYAPVWDRYYYDTLNRLWKVEYAQSSGFALAGGSSLSELAVVAAEWLECECDFTQAANRAYQAFNNRKQRLKESIEQNGLEAMVQSHPVPFERWLVKTETDLNAPIYSLVEFSESKANYRTETCTDEAGNIIAQIVWDNKDRMVLFAMYPDSGGTVIVSTAYDKEGNVISKIFTTLDKDGNTIETIDMLAYQEQQSLLAESRQSMSLDGGGLVMMSSSPEAPSARLDEFGYDHLGNRTTVYLHKGTMAQETQEYSHNSVNQYSTIDSTILGLPLDAVVEYDDNGNLAVDKVGGVYSYNYRNRLAKVEGYESNIIAEYAFDALGRRISKTVDSVTTYFFYDPQGRVIAEYENETLTKEFVYGNGFNEVLAMFTPHNEGNPADWEAFIEFAEAWLCQNPNACYDAAYDHNSDGKINLADFAYFAGVWDIPSNRESNWYYLHDALGSVRGLIGGRFNREEDREFYNYDVYGKSTDTSDVGNPFRFAGYRYDVETGLYHTPGRAYDPETGRWLSFDPIGPADSWNLYEYVMGNPVMYYDPLGLSGQNDCDFPQDSLQVVWPTGPVNPSMDTVRNPNAPMNYSNQGQGPIYIDQLNEGARNKFRHQDSGRFGSRENFRKQATPQTRSVPGPGLGVMIATEFAATQIATYGYSKYVNDLEKMARENLKRMGACYFLKNFEETEVAKNNCKSPERPTVFRFSLRGIKYTVYVKKDSNACWFNIYEHKRKFFFTLMRSHEIIEEVEKVGKCEAVSRNVRNYCK
jgi:RHS repeat-associated protein